MSKLVSALPSGYPKHCMPSSLAIIGAGRVGRALGRQLREAGWRIGAVLTRSEASARRAVRFIGAGKAFAGMTRQVLLSRVILIATPSVGRLRDAWAACGRDGAAFVRRLQSSARALAGSSTLAEGICGCV